MKRKGFTMVELMIALTIIAVLAAIIIPNMIRARIAANETASIAVCKKFGSSQEIYRRTDWDGNGIKEYAQNIGPNGGNGNKESLYFCIKNNAPIGLADESMVNAEIPGTGVSAGATPKAGYLFFVQLGATFPVVNPYVDSKNAMTGGYSICAIPAQYDLGGRTTFQMDSSGVLYKKDQGSNNLVAAYNVNPASNWVVVE